MMTAEQAQKALEALESGDAEAAKAILKEIIAAMVAGASEQHAEPDGDEGVAMREEEEQEPMQRDDISSGGGYRAPEEQSGAMRGSKARKPVDQHEARARKAADSTSKIAIRMRIKELRGDGIEIDTATETKLVALADIDAAEERIGYIVKGRETVQKRARSGAEVDSVTEGQGGAVLDVTGLPDDLASDLRLQFKVDPHGAKVQADSARARLASRKAGGL